MFISLERSRAEGFSRWSAWHQPDSNDNDDPDRGNTAVMSSGARVGSGENQLMTGRVGTKDTEDEHRPWLVPGVGSSF